MEVNIRFSKWKELGIRGRISLIILNIGILGLFGSLIHNSLNLNFIVFSSVLPFVFFIFSIIGTIALIYFDKKSKVDVKPLKGTIDK